MFVFSNQTIVGFLLFLGGLLFLFVKLRKWVQIGRKMLYAWFVTKVANSMEETLRPKRQQIFKCLHEMNRPLKVVEIGPGPGANFQFLPKNTEVTCVEPNEHFKSQLQSKAAELPGIKLVFQLGVGENMSSIATESVDAVVGTHVLCSVHNKHQTLREILRILKKDGKYIFMERVESEDGHGHHGGHHGHFWQHLLQSLLGYILHSHHSVEKTDAAIQETGFSKVDMETFNVENNAFKFLSSKHNPCCAGVATK